MKNEYYPFVNLSLPYAYDALEPFIDEKTMMLHHDRHLQAYIDNLNDVLKRHPGLQGLSLIQLLTSAPWLPEKLQTDVRRNAGGVFNHRFYFDLLKNPSEGCPSGMLGQAVDSRFGGCEKLKEELKKAALSVFGSGYAWLVSDYGALEIITTPNQDCPIEKGLYPVLAADVWEHAYYLKHYNDRSDYLDDLFDIINWQQAEKNYQRSMGGVGWN